MRTGAAVSVVVFFYSAVLSGCASSDSGTAPEQGWRKGPVPSAPEVAEAIQQQRWVGHAISYSGYRAGHDPNAGLRPNKAQILEDLRILEKRWTLVRVYASGPYTEDILEVIRDEGIGLRVMLGIWLGKEPGNEAGNAAEVARAVRLANAFADIVFAVNVGNEALIYWTTHPVPEDAVVAYIRQVKDNVPQPVTVADNYAWWVSDGAQIAGEVDFITVHTYPVWERKPIDEGLAFTLANIEAVREAHPGKPIMIGEAGWPSYTTGNLHVPRTGNETNQMRYHDELTAWARAQGITMFFFAAFDEPWKGAGTEGHWGFFTVDRKAKQVARRWFPELATDEPTSPAYGEGYIPEYTPLGAAFVPQLAERLKHGTANVHGAGIDHSSLRAVTTPEGGQALSVTFNGQDWGGVYFLFDACDMSAAEHLRFRARLPATTATAELKLEGPEGNAQFVNPMDYRVGEASAEWTAFAVPLAVFERIDLSRLSVISLWNPKDASGAYVSGDLVLGDMRLE